MRIDRLRLIAFGPFTDREIALDGPGMQIIYGPNGAGKSTSMRALEGLLFGIPPRTTDAWRHGNSELRVGARLLDEHGTATDFVRKKGNVRTLLDAEGNAVAEATLTALLGGTDLALYRTMFSLSQEALRLGGEQLLADRGDLGAALFGAGTGNAGARALLARLEEEAGGLFRPSGSKPQINDGLRRHKEATKDVNHVGVTANAWVALDKRVRDLQAGCAATRERETDVRSRRSHADRILRVFGPVNERAGILKDLTELGDAPVLALEAVQQRIDAQRDRTAAGRELQRAQKALATATSTLASLDLDPAVLARADDVDELREDVGRYRKNRVDLVRLRGEATVARREVLSALHDVDPTATLDDDAPSATSAAQAQRIRTLAGDHATAKAEAASADRVQADTKRTRDAVATELEALPAIADTSALASATRSAREAGDLDARVREFAAALESSTAALATEVCRLPLVGDELTAVIALPVPLAATIAGFVDEASTLDGRAAALDTDEVRLLGDQTAADDALRQLELAGDVPTEEDLHRIRASRDDRWSTVRQAWLGDRLDDEPVLAGPGLADAFSGELADADSTADLLRADAQRVSQKAQLVTRQERLHDDLDRLAEKRNALQTDRGAHEDRWTALWEPCGLTPRPPKEMSQWAESHRDLVRSAQAPATVRSSLAEARALRTEHREAIIRTLNADSVAPKVADDLSLGALLAEAESRCAAAETARGARKTLEVELGKQNLALEGKTAAANEARAALEAWQTSWASAVSVLRVDPEIDPASALAALDAREALKTRRVDLDRLESRIEGIERDIAAFESAVLALRVDLSEPEAADPEAVIATVADRTARAREAASAYAEAEAQREGAEAAIVDAQAAEHGARDTLAALCTAAGVAADDELPAAEERSATHRDLTQRLQDTERRIVDVGEDELLRLVEDVHDHDRDTLSAEAQTLADEEAALADEHAAMAEELGAARAELGHVDGGDAAAQKAETAQQALTEIAEGTERYVRVRLAAQLLRRAIESYRERTAGPVLRRANELFPELTENRFTGVTSDHGEDDQPVLLAVRGSFQVPVKILSSGERDALYLALRIATLEHYFATSEPMPLILDDLMLNLDDNRSKAAFRVLGRLMEQTQVLLFTHHPHLVDIAQEAVGTDRVRVQELNHTEVEDLAA